MTALSHIYRYDRPSALDLHGTPSLYLATSNRDAGSAAFFRGSLLHPRLVSSLLTTVQQTVGSRFFLPANSLQKKLALADPIVTAGAGLLRFEGFSACCSAYVRVDLLPDAYDGEFMSKGTTNVDFNAPMKAALARVRDTDSLKLQVGPDALVLERNDCRVLEKKVDLPRRWLRGLLEVQAYQSAMRPLFSVSQIEAARFIRSLPRSSTSKTPLWVCPGPRGLFSSTVATMGAVRVVESARLRLLEPLLPMANQLTVFADERQQASAWQLQFAGARLTLLMSAEVWRGFSGEGQALRALLQASNLQAVSAAVRAQLHWQASLTGAHLAQQLDFPQADIDAALTLLGASGLVGFDVADGSYFHRELPFELHLLDDFHPRLAAARELLAANAVRLLKTSDVIDSRVQSQAIEHRVWGERGDLACTCPWHGKHQGERGPCKHILAVQAYLGDT